MKWVEFLDPRTPTMDWRGRPEQRRQTPSGLIFDFPVHRRMYEGYGLHVTPRRYPINFQGVSSPFTPS